LPFLRVLVASQEEIDQFWSSTSNTLLTDDYEDDDEDDNEFSMNASSLIFTKPISIRNELASFRLLCQILSDQLASYPTTISQDEDIYRSLQSSASHSDETEDVDDAKSAYICAIIYRLTKKHLQYQLLSICESVCSMFTSHTLPSEESKRTTLSTILNLSAIEASIAAGESQELGITSTTKRGLHKLIQEKERIQEYINVACTLT
jgi:hypothetical protein